MRSFARVGLLTASSLLTVSAFAREPFQLPSARPASISEIDQALRGEDPSTSIPAYLAGAQCGGWDTSLGVGGYMAVVRGLPGRRYDWSGAIRSGMGTRIDANGNGNANDDYEFPSTTQGLATACDPGRDRDWKEVWEPSTVWETIDGEIVTSYAPVWHEFAYPYFEDPPCQWRIEGGVRPPVPLRVGEFFSYDRDSWETESADSCADFCGYVNSFVYGDCVDVQPRDITVLDGIDGDGNALTHVESIHVCNREAYRYICTDQEVEEQDWGAACLSPHPAVEEWSNARLCLGDQCRCPNTEQPGTCLQSPDLRTYQSYYRLYEEAGYSRDALTEHVPADDATKELQATCFGLYNEFDPLTRSLRPEDRRCVINVNVEHMKTTQIGKGTFIESGVQDRDPTLANLQRPGGPQSQPGAFDAETDVWYTKLGGAFSLVNERTLQDRYGGDLGKVFVAYDALDSGALRATPQLSDARPLAEGNLMRAFDDTGNARAYVQWWQEQQSRMAALVRPAILRIKLPSAWFMGLDPLDPFLATMSGATEGDTRANRSDSIELQIEAQDDLLGTALAYVERSVLLHVEEEPIPILLPMGSPAEFRARAADWCNWYRSTSGQASCESAPEDIRSIITHLEDYARRIDDYRELRAELAVSAGAILDVQRRLLEPIAAWFRDHKQELLALSESRRTTEQDLLPLWQTAQASLARLHDQTNLPWCMNQRFTSPIASEAPPVNDLPALPLVPPPTDLLIDFSALTTVQETIKLPVLKPIQVRLTLPTPPHPEPLADLPPVEDIRTAMANALGTLPAVINRVENPSFLTPPSPPSESVFRDAQSALVAIDAVLQRLNDQTETFWKSIGPLTPDTEQFDRQREFKTEMKCYDFDSLPCAHAEGDLLERVQRIGSRPLVQLQQDVQSIGTERSEPTVCLPEDDACHILNPERTEPAFRFEVHGAPTGNAAIGTLKREIFRLTQPPPLGSLDPRILAPYDDDPAPLRAFPAIRLTP